MKCSNAEIIFPERMPGVGDGGEVGEGWISAATGCLSIYISGSIQMTSKQNKSAFESLHKLYGRTAEMQFIVEQDLSLEV